MLNDTSRGSVRIPELRPGIMWTCTVRAATIRSIVSEREITKLTSGGLERDQNFCKKVSRGKEKKDLEHVFIGVLCSNKKKAKNMLEGGATLTVSHMKRRHAMKAA